MAYGLQQALPGGQAALVERANARHRLLERGGAQVQQQTGEPRQGAGKVFPIQAQGAHGVHEHAGQALENRQIGHRKHLLGCQVPGIAIRGPMAGFLAIDDGDAVALARQCQRTGHTDDACANHGDICATCGGSRVE